MSANPDFGLLDTSVVIALPNLDWQALPEHGYLSAISLAELSVGPMLAKDAEQHALRQAAVQRAEVDFSSLPFDAECARVFGTVAAHLHRSGRKIHTRTYDGLIAATAIANDLPLYTRNPSDFAGIPGLTVIAV